MGWNDVAVAKAARLGRAPNRGSAAGFSLIEVMIAIAVVAVGLLGIAAMQLKALRGGQSGRVFTQASEFAHDQLEQLRAQSVGNLTATGDPPDWSPPTALTAQVRNEKGNDIVTQTFQRSQRIANAGNNLWTIDVRVQWTNRNSDAVLQGNQGMQQIVISTARYRVAPTAP